jgi:hypothetical protein
MPALIVLLYIQTKKAFIMKRNVGIFDRVVRVIIAAILTILYFTEVVTGTHGIIFLIVAAISLITAATRFCGVYALFGLNSCHNKPKE